MFGLFQTADGGMLLLVQRALRLPTMEARSYAEAKQRFERNYLVQLLKLTDGSVGGFTKTAEGVTHTGGCSDSSGNSTSCR